MENNNKNNNDNNTEKKHIIGKTALTISLISTIIFLLIFEEYDCILCTIISTALIMIVAPISFAVFLICFDLYK